MNICVGIHLTRMYSVGRHSFALHDASQFLGEVDICQFAAAVGEEREQVVVKVLEVQSLVLVAGAGEGDDAARRALLKSRQQKIGQEEMAQVIYPKAHGKIIISPVQDAGNTLRKRGKKSPGSFRTRTQFHIHSIKHTIKR